MTIPFLDLFKKFSAKRAGAAEEAPAEVARPYPVAPAKPSTERLSKTVMPNTTRTSTASTDFFKAAGDSSPNIRAAGSRALPPTVALALQPKVERAITLPLSDVVQSMPVGFLKPAEQFDVNQAILLKASEIEQGMADGKPAVSLFSIYEQVPDIFVRNVRPDDATQVSVPHAKVLEQLRKMQVRDDQETEVAVPQVDTPILKVTIEDTERFGTKLPVITTSAHPPVKVEPATAKAISSAEPEPAAKEKLVPPPASHAAAVSMASPKITPRPAAPDPVAPTRIPFKLPPKGTDESASERVPASSSSSVPPSAAPAVQPPATRIPFKMTPPSDDLKPKLQIVPGMAAADIKKPEEAAPSGAKISLGLRAVAQNMPSFQLHKPADSVAADARFELPLSLVQSQLASGRVAVPVKTFRDALPEEYQSMVVIDAGEAPVLLPLQEVLKNLSVDALKMRDDQVVESVAEGFETPFSIKAAEDARRFSAELESGKTSDEVPAVEAKKESAPAPIESKPAAVDPVAKTRPEPGPVLKLPPIVPPPKSPAPVEPKVESKAAAPAKIEAAPVKPAYELKPLPSKPVTPVAPVAAGKPDVPPATPAPAIKLNVEAKPAAPVPKIAVPVETTSAKPEPKIEKLQPSPKIAPLAPASINDEQSSKSSPAPLKISSAPKLEPKTEPAVRNEAVPAEPLKLAQKPVAPAAVKLMPTAPAPARPDASQPLMQENPVPSQVPAEPNVAGAPVALKISSGPNAPASESATGPAKREPAQPNKSAQAAPFSPVSATPFPLAAREPDQDLAKAAAPSAAAAAPKVEVRAPEKPLPKAAPKTEVNSNAKTVVEEASRLHGVSAATILFDDGLALAGKLPDDVQAGGLCAVAPSILKKINRHTVDTKFGPLASMTLDWRDSQLTFFMAGAVCLGVLHSQPVLPAETHGRLTALTGELSRTYAQPGDKHVDH